MPLSAEPVSRRNRPAKSPLSRRAILDATLRLIRERGVEAVTLRDVARAVETGPASLYAYFGSRDVLLEHALAEVYGLVELVDLADDWQAALSGTIVNTIEVLESFPGIGVVALGTIPTLPGALRLAEHELTLMEAGGVADADAALAVDLIAQFAAATAIERMVRQGTAAAVRDNTPDALATYGDADPVRFPRVRRLASELTGPDERRRRDFSIRVILSGLTSAGRA